MTRLTGLDGAFDRVHHPHRGEPVVDVGAELRRSVEDAVREPLDLPAPEVRVFAERPVVLAVPGREALDLARPVVPGKEALGDHAAVLAVDVEALVPVHLDGHREVQVADRAVGELDADEPAVRAAAFGEVGPDRGDLRPARKRAVSTRWLPWPIM